LTSFITLWVGLTNVVPFSILGLVTYVTGCYGWMTSEVWKPQQQAQPTQQQAQMIGSFLASFSLCMPIYALLC